ncbi:MAG: hypothetical protein J6Q51_00105, partial [Clostridia bacterium]|nr:hypothetical protein [Clostridia bacterium]
MNLLLEETADFMSGFLEGFSSFFKDLWNSIPQVLYFIVSCCLMVLDFAQLLFRKVVGLDTYYMDGSVVVNPMDVTGTDVTRSGDLILQLIQKVFFNEEYSVIRTTFISLIVLSAILLVITTIAAIIRNEYSPDKEKKNSKAGIIKNFLKAIASFFIIPIAAYFGVWMGNAVLFAVDSATAPQNTSLVTMEINVSSQLERDPETGSFVNYAFFGTVVPTKFTPMSAVAAKSALYTANRVRRSVEFYNVIIQDSGDGTTRHFGVFNQFKQTTSEQDKTATCIDDMFMMNAGLKTEQVIDSATLYSGQGWWDFNTTTVKYFNRYDVGLVSCYYDLWWYMWPIPIIFIAVVWRTLVNMAFGLLSRIINIFGLILVNPLVCSIMPLDGGSALTTWRKSFVSQLISAYFVVFVLNIFYIIYPLINSVSLFGGTTALESFPDLMFRFFFLLAGIQAISSMDKLFEKMFGRDDKSSFINDGKDTLETVEKGTKEAWGVAKGAARVTAGAAMAAVGTVGTVAGAGIGGIRALHDRAQENQARTERDRHAAGANRTNAELRTDAMNNARGSTEYQNAYNTEVNNRMNQSYADYQAAGGGLTRDQWEGSATGSGSAFEAHNSWSNMTAAEKAAAGYGGSGGYARYMADQYNSGGQSGTTSYKDWLATGKTARNEFEVDANGNVVGKGGFAGHDA